MSASAQGSGFNVFFMGLSRKFMRSFSTRSWKFPDSNFGARLTCNVIPDNVSLSGHFVYLPVYSDSDI